MASGVEHLDSIIKEYLLFRGYVQTARQLDAESKNDKDKGFRADLVLSAIVHYITTYDLQSLINYWAHLDRRVFSRLEQNYHSSTKKLYYGLLKYYVVYATMNNKSDKVSEFFTKMALDLQKEAEWKDWFALPFVQNPASNPIFSTCFNKQWQDALQLSLHNYISVCFQCMPAPTLMNPQKLADSVKGHEHVPRRRHILRGSMDMIDDFHAITQQIQVEDPNQTKQSKSILAKGFAKVTGQSSQDKQGKPKGKPQTPQLGPIPTGPMFPTISETPSSSSATGPSIPPRNRRQPTDSEMRQELLSTRKTSTSEQSSGSAITPSAEAPMPMPRTYRKAEKARPTSTVLDNKYNFLADATAEDSEYVLLSQDVYAEHRGSVTHAKFSRTGHVVASADADGVVKIWSRSTGAVPETLATVMSKSPILCVEWLDKTDSMILIGGKPGTVKVYDVNSKKAVSDILVAPETSSTKLSDMCVQENGSRFACSSLVNNASSGLISIWDVTTSALVLRFADDAIQSLEYCRDGRCLLAGSVDGNIKLIDTVSGEEVRKWHAHSGKIYSMQITTDCLSCFSMDSDQTVSQWNLDSGKLLQSFSLHDGASGPFIYSEGGNHKQVQTPKDKLFAMDATNTYMLTCYGHGAQLYKIVDGEVKRDLSLVSHQAPVAVVDWSVADSSTETCLTGDMVGSIKLSSLLTK